MGLVLVLLACAPSAPEMPAGSQGAQQREAPAARKVVTVSFAREATGVEVFGVGATGRQDVMPLVHNLVVYEKDYGVWAPQLAVEMASVDKGTWRVNSDATMEMTWKFHPNIRWHDGTPFSAEDIVFAVGVRKDPDMTANDQGRIDLIASLSAPDPLTLITRWSAPYVDADRARSTDAMPRHILQELYQLDKRAFERSAYWNTEFVGLGPYKVVRWEQGSHIELARYDDYHLGRPKLDGIIVRFISDANTLVAAFLAGTMDVATDRSDLSIEAARELERRWQTTSNNRVRYDPNGGVANLQIQFREEFARPRDGFTNRAVRQALYHALDRPTLAEILTDGIAPLADSWYHPSHPLRSNVESAIPQFPYDPNRAQQLLAQAGWARGPDGVLVHQSTAERFESEIWSSGSDQARWAVAFIEYWKAVGAELTPHAIPASLTAGAGREYNSKRPGPRIGTFSAETYTQDRPHSKAIPTATNRWTGTNEGGYVNPRVDAILERIARAIDPREKATVHRELVQEMMGDIHLMPLWWNMIPTVMANGVRGVKAVTIGGTLSSFEWDKD